MLRSHTGLAFRLHWNIFLTGIKKGMIWKRYDRFSVNWWKRNDLDLRIAKLLAVYQNDLLNQKYSKERKALCLIKKSFLISQK